MNPPHDAVIIGAGLAGLSCALHLQRAGRRCLLLEADTAPGGRVQTDRVEGFLLDRGFQVFLTAYPEAQGLVDGRVLGFRPFAPGALIRWRGAVHRLDDPFRVPASLFDALRSPVSTFADKLRVGLHRASVCRGRAQRLLQTPGVPAIAALKRRGYSPRIIETFFRPFYSGVFLEPGLATSSAMLDFTFRMFASGDVVLPATGMGAIPAHLAEQLEPGTLRLGRRVSAIEAGTVVLEGGQRIEASAVVIATAAHQVAALVPGAQPDSVCWNATACLYFDAPEAPYIEPMLMLDAEGSGPINHLAVLSNVARSYAPDGRHLISASTVGIPNLDDAGLEAAARQQLAGWFGPQAVGAWRLLRLQRIPHALPRQLPDDLSPPHRPAKLRPGLFLCGDHRAQSSSQGALASGRLAAEAVLAA